MPRRRRPLPWFALREGCWYLFWYDPACGRTRRKSCRTADRSAAEEVARSFPLPSGAFKDQKVATKLPATTWQAVASRLCRRAKSSAKEKGREYSLTTGFVLDMLRRQQFKCAVTGLPLRLPQHNRDPWAPSIDQIKPGEGYREDNIRVVSMLANLAMNTWGSEPLLELVSRLSLRS